MGDNLNHWLLFLLTLIPEWEAVDIRDCSEPKVSVIPVNTTALQVSWRNVSKGFKITFTLEKVTGRTNENSSSVIFGGLQQGIGVEYNNCSSNTTQPVTTNPSPVTSLSLVITTTKVLVVSWTVPNDTRVSEYTYNITVTSDTGAFAETHFTERGQNMFHVTDLKPGVQYNLMVKSVTPENTLNTSEIVEGTTNQSPVTSLSVVSRTTESLEINWTVPNDTTVSKYNITVRNDTGNLIQTNSTEKGKNTFNVTGLKPGVQYNLTVQSVTPENTLSAPESVKGTTNPSPVTSLSVLDRTTDSLTINWTVPNDTRVSEYTYNITVSSDTLNFTQTHTTEKGKNTFNVTGLKPGVQYNLTVQSVTPENTLSTPEIVKGTTNPSPVTSLFVLDRTTDSLTINWTVPNDIRFSEYTYNITVSSDTANFTQTHSTEKGKNTFNVTGLKPGVQYNLTVQSVTPENTLSTPEIVKGTTNPSPVTSLSVLDRTTDSLTINWTFPNDTRVSEYTYNITVSSDTLNFAQTHTAEKEKNTFNVTGLIPGVQYNLTVQSVTPENTLSTPEIVKGTTNPSPVTSLSVLDRTTDSLTINWTFPNDTRVSEYTYNITVSSDTLNFAQTHTAEKGKNTFNVTGLKPGVQYNLTVQSVTPENTLSTPEFVKGTTNPSPVTSLSVLDRTTDSLTINWTVPNDTRVSEYTYNITVSSDTLNFTQTHTTEKGKNTFNVTGLKPGVQYNLTVQSVTPENTLSTPEIVKGTTNPSPVTSLSVLDRTTDSLTINWTVPNDIRFSEYTYNITVSSDTANFTQTHSTEKGKNTFNVTGLKPGVQYNLTVQSVTPENTLSTPEIVKGTTNPSPVTSLSVLDRTTDSLTINWTFPNDIRFSEYTYNITVSSDTANFMQTNSTEKGKNTFKVTGLKPGFQYNLMVQSVTPETTLSTPEIVKGTTNPSPVTSLSVLNRTTDLLTINWTVPDDTRVSEYTYNITVSSDTANFTQTLFSKKGENTFNVTGLEPGFQYNLTVKSVTPENTLSTPEIVKGSTIPASVPEIYCDWSTGYMINVQWTKPMGHFTGFNISLYDGDQLLRAQTIGRNKNSLTIRNLQPARIYTVHIYTQAGRAYSEMVHRQCQTEKTPIIIGAVIGSLLCLILIGLLLLFIINGRLPWRKQDSDFSPMTIIPREIKPVPVSEYEDYFQRKHADTDFGFAEEYQSLSMVGVEQSVEAALLVDNKRKNRYTNVLPYDASRVKLIPQLESSTSDYINANYMPSYRSNKEFIAAQGPLPNTVADFWRMIWEQKSKVIVMLTNCVEVTRVKCEHYWPLDYTPCTYGDITVTVTSETIQSEWTLRNFSIKKDGSSEIRSISHFQFTAWPDHGVPDTTEKLIAFHKLIQHHLNMNQQGPTVIHCSQYHWTLEGDGY
ncbi:receptor-type tyrosine-protein phosphatase H isoform X2 [Carcharodon carcharias]|uniref:receptor-type tyrosine-protein phosphatase H isoform X2 n=1 Tax=Carcharodon carcharias TaxID=13397 RepID=UPI001B7DDDA5|nr:receptor-type tyrosine-protein phosphatase H isoform X2 [Carcharodon carcharias]